MKLTIEPKLQTRQDAILTVKLAKWKRVKIVQNYR